MAKRVDTIAGPTVLLLGLGDLGAVTLELLAREPAIGRIVAGSRDASRGRARCNLARLGALAQGFEPDVSFRAIDLNAIDRTAEAIHEIAPDLILCAATRQSWIAPHLLPSEAAAPLLRAGFGVWLPIHLTLVRKLMQAVRAADYAGPVLTAPFPDVVNYALGKVGLAPTCGVGNVDEAATKVRAMAADRLGVPAASVAVTLVAHHALEKFVYAGAPGETPPWFLRVERQGRDVTDELGERALLFDPMPLPEGLATHFFTAASTARLIKAVLSEGETRLHAPAPGGLPGGYPVLAGGGRVRPAPIEGLTLDEAIGINERSHRFEGIERIEADGTVVFLPEAVAAMRDALGYDCAALKPDEADAAADELLARFAEYAARHGARN